MYLKYLPYNWHLLRAQEICVERRNERTNEQFSRKGRSVNNSPSRRLCKTETILMKQRVDQIILRLKRKAGVVLRKFKKKR